MSAKPFTFPPASFFGMPLGILGIGFAWRGAVRLWALPPAIAEAILAIGVAAWTVLIVLYAGKWLFRRGEAVAEVRHPIQCCFIGLAAITASLTALAALPYDRTTAVILFAAGATATLGFALFWTGQLWIEERDDTGTTAALYLPPVAGSFVTATAASQLGWPDWGQLAFGAGAFSWLAIESVLLQRLYTGPYFPPALRPTLGIQLAPPAVGAVAYLNVSGGSVDVLAQSLIGYALLQALLLARLIPWFREQSFVPSYWAFSFGAAALGEACVGLAVAGSRVEQALALPVFALSNLVILGLALGTLRLWLQGKLLPAPLPAAEAAR
jgi:tellurite resistance protein